VAASYDRALRTRALGLAAGVIDSDDHLAALVLDADRAAHDDLRTRALAPMAALRPATAERLEETLRSWLLHQGRREDVAAELFVHAQTVRYRMGQIRELYGDTLDDPDVVRDLVIALARPR
jgi:DNA-binding PucR family transcriptional regulator